MGKYVCPHCGLDTDDLLVIDQWAGDEQDPVCPFTLCRLCYADLSSKVGDLVGGVPEEECGEALRRSVKSIALRYSHGKEDVRQ